MRWRRRRRVITTLLQLWFYHLFLLSSAIKVKETRNVKDIEEHTVTVCVCVINGLYGERNMCDIIDNSKFDLQFTYLD